MTKEFLTNLIETSRADCGVVPRLNGRHEPLAGIYPVECASWAQRQLLSGDGRLQMFVEKCLDEGLVRSMPVAPEDEHNFLNLNTPGDYAAWRRQAIKVP